ncbi:MAG: asparagine--tRNA ligase [Oscillospiraceae bacterium]|nr:asparagine--tRNA ligase [Oscillospiraceae bacterium]
MEIKELFKNYEDYKDQEVLIKGWIRTLRDSKTFGFIEINDGSFFKNAQIVFEESLSNFKDVTKLPICTSISVSGMLILTPEAKQPFEIKAKEITVEGTSDLDYPLQKKRHSFEYLRTIAHLRPRSNTFSAVFRVRSLAAFAIHKFFNERGFVYLHAPIITGTDAEGAGEMFRVTTLDLKDVPKDKDGNVDTSKDFFGKESNLTVTGQLHAECYALAFKKTYTFGPTFRAENSNTFRHAAEFWMIEPEIAFADLSDNMDLAEDMVKYIINYVRENAPEEMEFLNKMIDKGLMEKLDNVVNSDFGRITYTEAIDILKESHKEFEYPVWWGMDIQTEHEKYIAGEVFKRPVFVVDYPKDIKAFYMRLNDDGKTVAAMDLLVPSVGEIIGGSQREERYDVLKKRISELHMNEENYWWYLELRKYGGTKHAGYGLGFERMLMYLTGMANIRDVIPFPRTTGNLEF